MPLLLVLAAFAYAVLPLVDGLTVRWFMRDLDIRAALIANTVGESIENSIRSADDARIIHALARITEDERVYAVAFCTSPQAAPFSAGILPDSIRCADLDAHASGYEIDAIKSGTSYRASGSGLIWNFTRFPGSAGPPSMCQAASAP